MRMGTMNGSAEFIPLEHGNGTVVRTKVRAPKPVHGALTFNEILRIWATNPKRSTFNVQRSTLKQSTIDHQPSGSYSRRVERSWSHAMSRLFGLGLS